MKLNIRFILISWLISYFCLPAPLWAQSVGRAENIRSFSSGQKKKVTDLNDVANDDLSEFGLSNGENTLNSLGKLGAESGMMQQITVHVLGDVKTPGVQLIGVTDRAADVVKRATLNRNHTRLIEIRHDGDATKTYDLYRYYYFGDLGQNPYLKDGDIIYVPKIRGAVRIEGPVARPNIYELGSEKNLKQIVDLAGGFTSATAFHQNIKVIRFDSRGEKQLIDVDPEKNDLQKFKVEKGDIYIVPDKINSHRKFDYSVETIPGENLIYPTSIPDVFVIGAVSGGGPYPYKSHLYIKDYMGFAGATSNANFKKVIVIRDGKRQRKKVHDRAAAGDVIIVKERTFDVAMRYVGIVSTLMSVTLSALVLKEVIEQQ